MKKSTIKIILIEIFILLSVVLNNFIDNIIEIKEFGVAIALGVAFVISILTMGFARERNDNKGVLTVSMFIITFLYQTVIFVFFGITIGFLKNPYVVDATHFFQIVLPILLINIFVELLRNQIIVRGNDNMKLVLSTIVLFVIVDLFTNISSYNLSSAKGIFELLSIEIFPSLTKNILLTFLCYNFHGFRYGIIFKLMMVLPVYYLPIYPDLSDYLSSTLSIVFPFIVLVYYYNFIEKVEIKDIAQENKTINNIYRFVLGIFCLFMGASVYLTCGLFKYYALVIGSGSMEPAIHTGDVILVKKLNKYDSLEEGNILVFKQNETVVVHRIVGIDVDSNGSYTFRTKGDKNNTEDEWIVNESQVIGTSDIKVRYIGYATLKLNELFGGD